MTALNSAIYSGAVVHRRLKPKGHLLKYSVFSLLIDLDELEKISGDPGMLKINKFGYLSFHERDHGDGRQTGLKSWVGDQLRMIGINPEPVTIKVLCYPRFLGYVFNPLTVFFCEDPAGETVAILYQVKNTMGETHTYVMPIEANSRIPFRHGCDKAMYVSPFTPMSSSYAFSIIPPGDSICVSIQQSDDGGPILNASFTGQHEPLTAQTLRRAVLRHPLMTIKVIAGIHLEAFKLWRKGVPFFRHTPQQHGTVSIIANQSEETTQSAV